MNALRTASGHPVTHVAFSPDGAFFATAQPHTGITLHDRSTGEPVRTVGSHRAATYSSLVFLDGAERVAASSSRGVEAFDVATGDALIGRLPYALVYSCRLAARGEKLLAISAGTLIEIELPAVTHPGWRTVWDEQPVHTLSPDGRWVVGFRVRAGPILIDLAAGKSVAALIHPARNGPYRNTWPTAGVAVAFAAGTPAFAVCDGKTVEVFASEPEPDGGDPAAIPRPRPVLRPVFRLGPPEEWPAGVPWLPPVVLTPDGRGLLVRRPKQRVQLWDVRAGRLVTTWSWRLEAVTSLAVAPDGLTAIAGGRFGRVVAWDLE